MDSDQPALLHQVVLFEESEALAVLRGLLTNGFDARIDRVQFAGEDDDADHAWAVWTDAPPVMLELAADQFDGWVVYEDLAASAPMDLPTSAKRQHDPLTFPRTL